jgi:hypothetical protein
MRAYAEVSAGPFQSDAGPLTHQDYDTHGHSEHGEHFSGPPGAFQQQQQHDFHEQEAYRSRPQYLPEEAGYSMPEGANHPEKHSGAAEPLGYMNSEIQEHRNRLAATMLA